jgi:hypothetical protein
MNLSSLASNAGFKGNLGNDIIFLILFLLVSFIISFVMGKHRLIASLLGVYVAYAVVSLANFDLTKDPGNKALLFLAILIGFIISFSRIIRANVSGHGPALALKLVIGTVIVVGFSISIILSWYPAKDLVAFITPNTRIYFTSDIYRFLWAIAPLVYLGVVRKRMD